MIIIKASIILCIAVTSLVFCIDTVNRYLDNRDEIKLQKVSKRGKKN